MIHQCSEILEILDPQSRCLHLRTTSLKNPIALGPPNMCYLIREHQPTGFKKLLSRPYTRSYYHYIYGTNTSSMASIAAYFLQFLDGKTVKNSKVVYGCFCVYDLFSKYDIRVEIQIPGHSSAYLINANGERFEADEVHWQGGYLSSVLRAMYPARGSIVATVTFFKTIEDVEEFMEITEKFWDKLGFVLGDINDISKYGVNLLFPALGKYLLRLKRYKVHQQVFRKYVGRDPLMLTFLTHSSIKMGKFDEIIRLLGNQIKITPHAFPLYFSMAKAYLKRQEIPQAIRLCQYLIELNLGVYDYWHLLILCYIKKKDYIPALLCLNIMPHYEFVDEKYDLEVTEDKIVLPQRLSYKAAGNIWITPSDLDFRAFEDQVLSRTSKEKTLLNNLNNLPGTRLYGSKARAYKLLVRIEKLIEWENLLKIKQGILKKTTPIPEEEEKIHTQVLSSQGPSTEFNKSSFNHSTIKSLSHDFTPEADPDIDE